MVGDKLSIINAALISTGNTPCKYEDGSDEWIVGSAAYDRMLPVALASGKWKFRTKIVALARLGASTFPGYADIYAKPADCLNFMNCWDTLLGQEMLPFLGPGMARDGVRPPPFQYDIIGDQIHCVGPNGVTAIYNPNPAPGEDWPPGFIESMTKGVESIVQGGLNEDNEARLKLNEAFEADLQTTRFQVDSEAPRKVMMRSSVVERRRFRRGYWGLER